MPRRRSFIGRNSSGAVRCANACKARMFAPFKSHSSESAGIQGDSTGKLVMESILETKAANFLQFIHGMRGSLHVTFEEGTCAAWLHDLGLNEGLAPPYCPVPRVFTTAMSIA